MLLLLEAESDLKPFPLFPKVFKQERLYLSCFLPWHFSHLHAEPWLKALGVETQEVGEGEKKLIQESSAWINGAKEQAEVAQLGVRRSLLMCCVRSLYRRLSSEVHKAKAFPV